MKKSFIFILLALLSMSGPAFARGGTQQSNQSTLVGMNVSGLEDGNIPGVPGVDYPIPTDAEYTYYRSKNIAFIRLPFLWERMQPTLGGSLNTTYLAYVTAAVTSANAHGMRVLLDVHNFGNYNGVGIGEVGGPTYAQFADLWTKIATAITSANLTMGDGSSGVYGYDLMNEPQGFTGAGAQWQTAAQTAITAIRTVDTHTTIYVEGFFYAEAYQWPTLNPNLQNITDPNNNIVFSAHGYADRNNCGCHFIWSQEVAAGDQLTSPVSPLTTSILVKRYSPFVQWCQQYGFKCHIGEGGVGQDDPSWNTTLDIGMNYLLANNVAFSYFGAGPYFPTNAYPMGFDKSQVDGTESPQASVIEKYTNAYTSNTYLFSGPPRGAIGMNSPTPFVINYRGYLKKTITFTMSDSGAGGTFTSPTITLSPGFNPSGSTYYMAAASDVFSISATNNGGLTDALPVGYVTVPDNFSTETVAANNIFGMSKIYAPYVGPLVNLRRGSDNATKDFYATSIHLNAPLDLSAIQAWTGVMSGTASIGTCTTNSSGQGTGCTMTVTGSTTGGNYYVGENIWGTNIPSGTTITALGTGSGGAGTYTICASQGDSTCAALAISSETISGLATPLFLTKWYDQSSHANHMGPRGAGQGNYYGPNTTAEQPAFLINDINGLPGVRWGSGNGLDANSPINGATGLTILSAFNNTQRTAGALMTWTVAQTYMFPNNGIFGLQNEYGPIMAMASDTTYHTHFGRYKTGPSGVANGVQVYKDGIVIQQADSTQTSINLQYTNTANFGWFKYYLPSYFQGDTPFIIIFPGAVADSTITNFQTWAQSVYNTPNPISQAIPTAPAVNTTSATTLPAWGVNADGAEFNSNIIPGVLNSDYFISPRPTAQAAYYQSRGLLIMRYPIAWERIQPVLGGPLAPTFLSQLQGAATAYQNAGVSVIFDIHNYGNYNANTTATPTGNVVTPTVINTTGTSSYGSPVITGIPSTTGMVAGEAITAQSIFGNTLIASVDSSTQVTLTQNCGATISGEALHVSNGNVITGLSSTANILPGYSASEATLPSGTVVHSVDSSTQVTLGAAVTTGGTGLSFSFGSLSFPIGSTYGPTNAQFADLWTKMATAFPTATYPKVNFDLMNEPVALSYSVGASAFQAAINGIRSVSTYTNYIFVEGAGSYSAASDFTSGGWCPYAAAMTDTSNKLIFEPHKYLDNDGSGSHDVLTQDGSTALVAATTCARANSLKLFLGETGWPNTPSGNLQMKAMIHYMVANPDVWFGATLWSGGAYPENYFYFTDPAGYSTPYVDKPQITLFANHSTL